MRLPVGEFEHHHPASGLRNSPVHRADTAVQSGHADLRDGSLDLVDGGELRQHPRNQLHVAQCRRLLERVEVGILAVIGEEEQSGREALLVHALDHYRLIFGPDAHVAVLGSEAQSILALRGQGLLLIAAGHDDIAALHGRGRPLHGARDHAAAVRSREGYSGACKTLG